MGITVILLLVGLTPLQVVASGPPLEQVRGTVEEILGVMKNEEFRAPEQKDERRSRIMALVDQRFDYEEMSKRTLARNWKDRTESEKKNFEKLFSELLKNTYIGRIEAYSDEKIEYTREIFDQQSMSRAMVYTSIVSNNRDIPINYMLINRGEQWLVYDVVIEGVSLVRNYRTEFARIISRDKFAGLMVKMQEKVAANEAAR